MKNRYGEATLSASTYDAPTREVCPSDGFYVGPERSNINLSREREQALMTSVTGFSPIREPVKEFCGLFDADDRLFLEFYALYIFIAVIR